MLEDSGLPLPNELEVTFHGEVTDVERDDFFRRERSELTIRADEMAVSHSAFPGFVRIRSREVIDYRPTKSTGGGALRERYVLRKHQSPIVYVSCLTLLRNLESEDVIQSSCRGYLVYKNSICNLRFTMVPGYAAHDFLAVVNRLMQVTIGD